MRKLPDIQSKHSHEEAQNPGNERRTRLAGRRGKNHCRILFPFAVFALAATPLHADEGSAAGGQLSLWALLQQGGWAMYPLAACSIAMFFLIFHCVRETAPGRFAPAGILPHLSSLLEGRRIEETLTHLQATPGVLARALQPALQKARLDSVDAGKEQIEAALAETIEHEENGIAQWITYLNVVASVAPMIGLLGTVSGMIGAFQTISLGGMGRPELLAGDIGQALVTTATGLTIGIPAMIAYFVLRNRLENRMLETTRAATELIDTLATRYDYPEEPQSQEEIERV